MSVKNLSNVMFVLNVIGMSDKHFRIFLKNGKIVFVIRCLRNVCEKFVKNLSNVMFVLNVIGMSDKNF